MRTKAPAADLRRAMTSKPLAAIGEAAGREINLEAQGAHPAQAGRGRRAVILSAAVANGETGMALAHPSRIVL